MPTSDFFIFFLPFFFFFFFNDTATTEIYTLSLHDALPISDRIGTPEDVVLADIAHKLAKRMGGAGRIAHQETPRAAELCIDIGARTDSILRQRMDETVDPALGMRPVIGALAPVGFEAGVIDDEVDVGEPSRRWPDIGAGREFERKPGKGKPLMDRDVLDAERACFLDEGHADPRIVEPPAHALRAELRVDLPGPDRIGARGCFHAFQLASSVRYDRRVKEKAAGALEALHEGAHPDRFLDIERIVLGEPQHEAQHCNLRVTVDEDLLDEAVSREAGDGIRFAAASLREASERTPPQPLPSR